MGGKLFLSRRWGRVELFCLKVWLCLLVRQSRIFRVCGVLLVRFFFKSRYVPRNLCTESAVPEEATRQGKVSGQESNVECSL